MDRRTFNKTLGLGGAASAFSLKPSRPALFPSASGQAGEKRSAGLLPFDTHCYRLDGKPTYLYSGEFHYFRVPKADWRRRMDLFREAGGNAVATYIPWYLHEPEEGRFLFGGESDGLDLVGFLHTAHEAGLLLIARPGPYQYTEMKYDGLAGWLCENYPELRAQDIHGRFFRVSSISYLHPLFLEKARKWFDQVAPIIAEHTVSRGGPIAFTQLDNEMAGIHIWYDTLDYNPVTMGFGNPEGRYARFLRKRYGEIGALNSAYATTFAAFQDVRPIVPSDSATPAEVRRARDYFNFYLGTVAEYAGILAGWLREHGVNTPFFHNSGGPGMNAYFLETVEALGNRTFLLGSDHYYNLDQSWPQNNPTPQYALNAFCSLEMLRLMGYPPTVLEMPSGSAADWPPVTASDCKTCYWTNLAFGMKANNYYIFTGGPNPPDAGTTTDIYDYGAPIGAKNEIRPLYYVQKELGDFLKARPWLEESERVYDCRFALDFEYARADQYWKRRGEFLLSSGEAWDFLRKGALTSALCASLSPVFCDLRKDDWIQEKSTPLVLVSSSSLAADKQQRVVHFMEQGGKVLIAPVLPAVDENLNPCTVLRDFLGRPSLERNPDPFARVTVLGVPNILDNGENFYTQGLPAGAQVLGKDEHTGRILAWEVGTVAGGKGIFLGFRWLHAMREHSRMMEALLERLGLVRCVECSNPNLWTSLRAAGNHSVVFLMNLFSSRQEADVSCRLPGRAGKLDTGHHKLEAMTVKYLEYS